jgi:hypothetical protein
MLKTGENVHNPAAVADHLAQSILAGEVSQQTRHGIEKDCQ